jgi:cell shape-determining protein MreC
MSYLLDKKSQRKKFFKIALGAVLLIFLFYFRFRIFNGLSFASQIVFRPVLVAGNNIEEKMKSFGAYFVSKNYLYNQNQKLQAEVDFNNARNANYDSIVADNASLKEILNRLPTGQAGQDPKANIILSAILAKPNQSPYDTLLIDAGAEEGIKVGNTAFALGNIPIGRVDVVYDNSAKVVLFSNPGETTEAVFSSVSGGQAGQNLPASRQGIFIQLVGRGGGNFEIDLPKDFTMQKGDQAILPGINPYVLAIAQTIISDPRDPFNKALLTSPVNIQELKFVEVEE